MKKLLSLIIVGIMFTYTMVFSCFASENIPAGYITFEKMISRYFENEDMTVVLDKAGSDITSEFFACNTASYVNGNYQNIRDYLESYVSELHCRKVNELSPLRLGTSMYVSDYGTMLISDKYGHKGYLTMEVGGTIIYDRNTGEILRAYNAKLVSADYSDFYDWTFTNKNITTSSRISSDKFTAYFKASLRSIGRYPQSPLDYDFGYHEFTTSTQAGD